MDFARYHFDRYARDAKKREINFDLSFSYFSFLIQLPCYYCNRAQDEFVYNKGAEHRIYTYYCMGVDRVNRQKGYRRDNVVPCCKRCNRNKWNHCRDDANKFNKMVRSRNYKRIIKYLDGK